MSDRFLRESLPSDSRVCFRGMRSGAEYIDIEVNLLCPACPEDEEQGVLDIVNDRPDKECWAVCKKCGYEAIVSVYEGG